MVNPALAGNIGALIANRFRLILDYSRKHITFDPSPPSAIRSIAPSAASPSARTAPTITRSTSWKCSNNRRRQKPAFAKATLFWTSTAHRPPR